MSTRRTLLYRETGKRNSAGANILTRGGDVRKSDPTLLPRDDTTSVIDIHCGQFWISNLPDLTHSNEAYLEITVITTKQNSTHEIKIPHMFKYQIEVEDQSFCSNISGAELLAGIGIYSDGFELQCRLTELDKIDTNKFNKIKGFVDKNDLTTLAQQLLASAAPLINTQQLLNMIYDTAEIIDEINDDDRVWLERPKIDLRQQATNPLMKAGMHLLTQQTIRRKSYRYTCTKSMENFSKTIKVKVRTPAF